MSQIQIPRGWDTYTLDEVCIKITDGEHIKPKILTEGIPFLSAKNIKDNGIDFDNILYVDENDAKQFRKKCNPERGDLLVASRGTIGKSCLVDTDKIFCLLGSVILLKPSKAVKSKFVLYYLKSNSTLNQLLNSSGHTAVQALYLKDIKKLRISLPPIPIQEKIVQKLDYILG